MRALRQTVPGAWLCLCGGALAQALRGRIAGSAARGVITLVEAMPRHQVLRALRSARLFVLPSLWEGLPIAPIEALYSGLPVIASKVGGTDEVVIDRVNGRLIEPFSPDAYAAAIREILEDDTMRGKLARAGRELVEQRFLRTMNSARHLDLYRQLLTRS